jgi:hypothetical protein
MIGRQDLHGIERRVVAHQPPLRRPDVCLQLRAAKIVQLARQHLLLFRCASRLPALAVSLSDWSFFLRTKPDYHVENAT